MPQFPAYDEKINVVDDDIFLIADSEDSNETKRVKRKNIAGVKKYVALLTQSGEDAPVATVLENTLGGTVVWTREPGTEDGAGYYYATLAGAFTANKTIVITQGIINLTSYAVMQASVNPGNVNSIEIYTGTLDDAARSDDILSNSLIMILVYP